MIIIGKATLWGKPRTWAWENQAKLEQIREQTSAPWFSTAVRIPIVAEIDPATNELAIR